jgi:hypothetical protein
MLGNIERKLEAGYVSGVPLAWTPFLRSCYRDNFLLYSHQAGAATVVASLVLSTQGGGTLASWNVNAIPTRDS